MSKSFSSSLLCSVYPEEVSDQSDHDDHESSWDGKTDEMLVHDEPLHVPEEEDQESSASSLARAFEIPIQYQSLKKQQKKRKKNRTTSTTTTAPSLISKTVDHSIDNHKKHDTLLVENQLSVMKDPTHHHDSSSSSTSSIKLLDEINFHFPISYSKIMTRSFLPKSIEVYQFSAEYTKKVLDLAMNFEIINDQKNQIFNYGFSDIQDAIDELIKIPRYEKSNRKNIEKYLSIFNDGNMIFTSDQFVTCQNEQFGKIYVLNIHACNVANDWNNSGGSIGGNGGNGGSIGGSLKKSYTSRDHDTWNDLSSVQLFCMDMNAEKLIAFKNMERVSWMTRNNKTTSSNQEIMMNTIRKQRQIGHVKMIRPSISTNSKMVKAGHSLFIFTSDSYLSEDDYLDYQYMISSPTQTRPLKYNPNAMVIYTINHIHDPDQISFDIALDQATHFISKRRNYSLCVCGDILLFGGIELYDDHHHHHHGEEGILLQKTTTTRRHNRVSSDLYVIKYDPYHPGHIQQIEKKEYSTNISWPCARHSHSVCSSASVMYIYGGIDENGNVLNDLYSYDSHTKEWNEIIIDSLIPPSPIHCLSSLLFHTGRYLILKCWMKNESSMDDILKDPKTTTTSSTTPISNMITTQSFKLDLTTNTWSMIHDIIPLHEESHRDSSRKGHITTSPCSSAPILIQNCNYIVSIPSASLTSTNTTTTTTTTTTNTTHPSSSSSSLFTYSPLHMYEMGASKQFVGNYLLQRKKENYLVDVAFKLQDETFSDVSHYLLAHKCVIAARCPYLYQQILDSTETLQRSEFMGGHITFPTHDMCDTIPLVRVALGYEKIFELYLNFIYSGEVKLNHDHTTTSHGGTATTTTTTATTTIPTTTALPTIPTTTTLMNTHTILNEDVHLFLEYSKLVSPNAHYPFLLKLFDREYKMNMNLCVEGYQQYMSDLKRLYESKLESDIQLVFSPSSSTSRSNDNNTTTTCISSHRLFLSRSPYLSRVFVTGGMYEANSEVVEMDEEYSFPVMENIIQYFYTDQIHLNGNNCLATLLNCNLFEMPELSMCARSIAIDLIDDSNVWDVMNLALSYHEVTLRLACESFISTLMDRVSKKEELLALPYEVRRTIYERWRRIGQKQGLKKGRRKR